jgi:hypothetical protein
MKNTDRNVKECVCPHCGHLSTVKPSWRIDGVGRVKLCAACFIVFPLAAVGVPSK